MARWGRLRSVTLRHPMGQTKPFDRIFNLGPIPWGGDVNTVAQASNSPLDPLGDPIYLGTMRMCVDVGEWDSSRFVLCAGQSGNPFSRHYADQWPRWQRGETVPFPYTPGAVKAATVATLRLVAGPTGVRSQR